MSRVAARYTGEGARGKARRSQDLMTRLKRNDAGGSAR